MPARIQLGTFRECKGLVGVVLVAQHVARNVDREIVGVLDLYVLIAFVVYVADLYGAFGDPRLALRLCFALGFGLRLSLCLGFRFGFRWALPGRLGFGFCLGFGLLSGRSLFG